MMFKDEFSTYNPITNVVFFLGAIILGMFFMHPIFVGVSLVMGMAYLFSIKKAKAFKEIGFFFIIFVLLSVINPIFNMNGMTVLFWYLGNRPYTLESLLYGMTLGGLTVAILCWFSCYNTVMTSDKFIYTFGKIIPSVSLVLSMILRLIPNFIKKTKQINQARECIGMAGSASASRKEKIRNGTVVLSTLTAWALEGGIITADSMKSRGYGSGKRTNFAIYSFTGKNIAMIIVIVLLMGFTIFCSAKGATYADFDRAVTMTWFGDIYMLVGVIVYAIFLFIPTFLNIKENVRWRILRSKI